MTAPPSRKQTSASLWWGFHQTAAFSKLCNISHRVVRTIFNINKQMSSRTLNVLVAVAPPPDLQVIPGLFFFQVMFWIYCLFHRLKFDDWLCFFTFVSTSFSIPLRKDSFSIHPLLFLNGIHWWLDQSELCEKHFHGFRSFFTYKQTAAGSESQSQSLFIYIAHLKQPQGTKVLYRQYKQCKITQWEWNNKTITRNI